LIHAVPSFQTSQPPARPDGGLPLHTAEAAAVSQALSVHGQRPGALLPVLHAVQDALGHIPATAVPVIAQALNLSRAEVHGVVSYYHHFRSAPPGRHVVQVCAAEACQSCGGAALMAQAERLLACKPHETRADGAVTLEPVYCLGLCASSPALQIDDRLHGRVSSQRLERLIAELGLSA
jgi:formate dehydrogenase subunit gamma